MSISSIPAVSNILKKKITTKTIPPIIAANAILPFSASYFNRKGRAID
jgi:hypothetical protein